MILGPKFSTNPVADFPAKFTQVVEIPASSSVLAACRVLIKQNLQSAPVYDEGSYLGFFDIQDAVSFATSLDDLVDWKETEENSTSLRRLFELKAQRAGKQEGAISVTSNSLWLPVDPSTPMRVVVDMLANKVRRVPVVDPKTKRVCKVVSQSLVCNEIADALKSLDDLPCVLSLPTAQPNLN